MDDVNDPIEETPENQGLREQAGKEEEQELKEAEDKAQQLAQQGTKIGKKAYKAVKKGKKGAKGARAGGGAPAEGAEAVAAEQGAEVAGEAAAEAAGAATEGLGAAVAEGGAAAGVETVAGVSAEVAGGAAVGGAATGGGGAIGGIIVAGGWIVILIVIIILLLLVVIMAVGGGANTTCSGGITAESTVTSQDNPDSITIDGCPDNVSYSWSEDNSTKIGGSFNPDGQASTVYTPPSVTQDTQVTIDVNVCSGSSNCSNYSITLTVQESAQSSFTFVALGDSLTAWPCYPTDSTCTQTSHIWSYSIDGKPWPTYLAKDDSTLILAYNAGYPAKTSTYILGQEPGVLSNYHPDVLFVLAGTNDPGNGLSSGTTTTNLNQIVQNAKGVSSIKRIILLTIPNQCNGGESGINTIIKNVASADSVPVIDISRTSSLTLTCATDYYTDGLHLNDSGAQKVAAYIDGQIKARGLLPQPPPAPSFHFFCQYDSSYSNANCLYTCGNCNGTTTCDIKHYGCGPTSAAMILKSLGSNTFSSSQRVPGVAVNPENTAFELPPIPSSLGTNGCGVNCEGSFIGDFAPVFSGQGYRLLIHNNLVNYKTLTFYGAAAQGYINQGCILLSAANMSYLWGGTPSNPTLHVGDHATVITAVNGNSTTGYTITNYDPTFCTSDTNYKVRSFNASDGSVVKLWYDVFPACK